MCVWRFEFQGKLPSYSPSVLRAFEKELGVQAPVGVRDPVGFTADGSVRDTRLQDRQLEFEECVCGHTMHNS